MQFGDIFNIKLIILIKILYISPLYGTTNGKNLSRLVRPPKKKKKKNAKSVMLTDATLHCTRKT
jgi:hypothetical protein